jgi:hypothetical protein
MKKRKPTPYVVVWCTEINSYVKYEETWDCFYNYEDAVKKYERLNTREGITNLKLTHVVKEPEIGVNPQEYYA